MLHDIQELQIYQPDKNAYRSTTEPIVSDLSSPYVDTYGYVQQNQETKTKNVSILGSVMLLLNKNYNDLNILYNIY